jgi:hypothetical protein
MPHAHRALSKKEYPLEQVSPYDGFRTWLLDTPRYVGRVYDAFSPRAEHMHRRCRHNAIDFASGRDS